MIKVLFCVRHNFHDSPGGAQIQILKTIKYLQKLNVICDITTTAYDINYNYYDILHLTDLTWVYDNILYLEEIEKQNFKGKKVLSTIYWPFEDYADKGAPFWQKIIFKIFGINGFEAVKSLGKYFLKRENIYLNGLKNTYINNQKKILDNVDMLLPNSIMELEALNNRLGYFDKDFSIVYNAIDTVVFDEIKENTYEKNNNLIVFVARIDSRKNQINFLKAVYDTDYEIVFIGNPGPNSKGYLKKLKKISKKRGNVKFVSHMSQEEVFKYMLKAKASVLTSWIETPGLVSLEAAYANCNLIISNKGSVKEYFKDYAFYCSPDNQNEIRKATIDAMNSNFNSSFLKIINNQFSWEITAKSTLKAYQKALGL